MKDKKNIKKIPLPLRRPPRLDKGIKPTRKKPKKKI